MLTWFTKRADRRRKASELYGAVVTFARRPMLYEGFGVADTPEGRYEILVLHLFVVMERLRAAGDAAVAQSQSLLEVFVTDLDDNMREMGIGDLTVPRKVKKAAAAFYDRAEEYRAAMATSGDQELVLLLERLIPAAEGRRLDAAALAVEIRAQTNKLAAQSLDRILAGELATA